jgi:hypothetical protein
LDARQTVLAEKLYNWYSNVDRDNELDWYQHVVKENFGCGCGFDIDYDGIEYLYCTYWRWERHKVEDVVQAEKLGYVEKERRYQLAWSEAINFHARWLADEDLYKNLRLAGERYEAFIERITP